MSNLTFANPAAINRLFTLRREGAIGWRALGIGIVISSFGGSNGKTWPSRATISRITGIDPRHISEGLRELEKAGFLTVETRLGDTNKYSLTLDRYGTPAEIVIPDRNSQGTPDDSGREPLMIPAPEEVLKKQKKKLGVPPPAFEEWKVARRAAGKTDPVPGKGNFAAARKLEELIPDSIERQKIMAAFFRLPDENGWLAGRGHALWQLVNYRLDEARQAAADANQDDNPPELIARIKAGLEDRRKEGIHG